jgi:hypothetical protein
MWIVCSLSDTRESSFSQARKIWQLSSFLTLRMMETEEIKGYNEFIPGELTQRTGSKAA